MRLKLKWDQVRNGFIYLTKTKNSEGRQIEINDDLNALFKQIRKRQHITNKYVFTYAGKRIHNIKDGFQAACKRAGITDFRFHDLRHTAASHLVMAGESLKDVQEISGHKSMKMTLRYAHLSQEHKRKAIKLLSGLTNSHK